MPSKSPAQKHLMDALAHGWKPPKGSKVARIPVSVAKDFVAADKKAGISHHRTGQHDGSSAAMAKGGSAFSVASRVSRSANSKCNG